MWNYLEKIKLTLGQWLIVSIGAIFGFLLLLLRNKNIELHKAKVALLKARHGAQTAQDKEKVRQAQTAYNKAYKEYIDAKIRNGR